MTGRKPTLQKMLGDLLIDLCVGWGFCISPADFVRLASSRHLTADEFASEELLAEGFDADVNYEEWSYWHGRIRQRFIDRFGEAVSAEEAGSPPLRSL